MTTETKKKAKPVVAVKQEEESIPDWVIGLTLFGVAVILLCAGYSIRAFLSKTDTVVAAAPAQTFHWAPIETAGTITITGGTTTTQTWSPRPTHIVHAPKDFPFKSVRVGPFTYKIEWRDDFDGELYGQTDPEHRIISINVHTPADYRDTMLHEIMHACANIGNYDARWHSDDDFLKSTTPTLVTVLQQNPELVKWLTEEKGGK